MFDLASLWTGQNETARGTALDAQLAALNNTDYAPGGDVYNNIQFNQGTAAADAAYATVQSDLAKQMADTASYNSQIVDAGVAGAKTGWQNVVDTLKNPFAGIPLAWWLIGGIALFLYMGGAGLLKGILKKKS